jgi:hypothetical protein
MSVSPRKRSNWSRWDDLVGIKGETGRRRRRGLSAAEGCRGWWGGGCRELWCVMRGGIYSSEGTCVCAHRRRWVWLRLPWWRRGLKFCRRSTVSSILLVPLFASSVSCMSWGGSSMSFRSVVGVDGDVRWSSLLLIIAMTNEIPRP